MKKVGLKVRILAALGAFFRVWAQGLLSLCFFYERKAETEKGWMECDEFFKEYILPGIETLEKLAGGLLISSRFGGGTRFALHLEGTRDLGDLEDELEINGNKIILNHMAMTEDWDSGSGVFFDVRFQMFSPSGEEMINDVGNILCGFEKEDLDDHPKRCMETLQFLFRTLCSLDSYPFKSALVLIRDNLEKQGEKMATRLYEAFNSRGKNLRNMERYGLANQVSDICIEIKQQAIVDGVGENGLALLDFEVVDALETAIEQKHMLDKNVPLIEKLRQREGHLSVEYEVVPGPGAAKSYNFLVHSHGSKRSFVRLLSKKGYGGSVVIKFYNLDGGAIVAETGQCDALVVSYDCNDWDLKMVYDMMRESQIARGEEPSNPPIFIWDNNPWCVGSIDEDISTCGGFDKFLEEHFPLQPLQ